VKGRPPATPGEGLGNGAGSVLNPMGMSDDKRSAPRVPNITEVDCYAADGTGSPMRVRMSDLSVTGAFLDSVIVLPTGTRLALHFMAGPQEMLVPAEVVHAMPQFGMGVRFLDLSPEGRAAIEALIKGQR
jgi:hypothetical protein